MNYNTNKNPVEVAGLKNNRQNDLKQISNNRCSYDIEINISVGSGYNKSSDRHNTERNGVEPSAGTDYLIVLYVVIILLFAGFPLLCFLL